MVTKEQAITAKHFQHVKLLNRDGTPIRLRATGVCKTWKTRPDEFKLPVKYGLYQSLYLTHENASEWNVA